MKKNLEYKKASEMATVWQVSERTVRNYCQNQKIKDAKLVGKTWQIPAGSKKPDRANKKQISHNLLKALIEQKKTSLKGGVYHKLQVEMAYNSNHIEGSTLTHDQTKYIYETNSLGLEGDAINVDDVLEAANHFRCFDLVIDSVNNPLSESFIKKLHFTLKNGTTDSRKDWFVVGDYKKLPNEVGGQATTAPEKVKRELAQLLKTYNVSRVKTFDEILDFHYKFEKIHPFQDGNGRIGRLILLKECLKNDIVPIIIDEELKLFYYRGLKEWQNRRGYLRDTCLTGQDKVKQYLDYFRIEYGGKND